MAHIEKRQQKRPDGTRGPLRWRARYTDPQGNERSKTHVRKSDAEKWLAAQTTAMGTADWVDPARGRVAIERWTNDWLSSVAPSLKPYTVASYESLLRSRVNPTFGKRLISTLAPSDVQAWVNEMRAEGLSPSRIRQAVIVLSQALDAAIRDGRIARNVTKGIKLPRMQRVEAPYLEPGQVERIANAMPDEYKLLVRVLGTLGLRFGEAAGLQRRHVDLLRRRLRIEQSLAEVAGALKLGPTKTHAVRSVPLPPSLASALEAHLNDNVPAQADAWVFQGRQGGALRHSAFWGRVWKPTLKSLDMKHVGIHVLRHSAVAAMISAGATPKAVQTVMGHRSVAFTLTVYGHMFDADLDDLALRLDALPLDLPRPVHGLAN